MGKKENNIQNEIRVELCKRGCKVFRTQVGDFYTKYGGYIKIGEKGESDLRGHRSDGKAFYIECKTLTGEQRKHQEKFINMMNDSGAIAGFARSVQEAINIVFKE